MWDRKIAAAKAGDFSHGSTRIFTDKMQRVYPGAKIFAGRRNGTVVVRKGQTEFGYGSEPRKTRMTRKSTCVPHGTEERRWRFVYPRLKPWALFLAASRRDRALSERVPRRRRL